MTESLPDGLKQSYLDTIPLKRFGSVDDIAKAVAWLAGDDASYVTGQIVSVNGGMVCLVAPREPFPRCFHFF